MYFCLFGKLLISNVKRISYSFVSCKNLFKLPCHVKTHMCQVLHKHLKKEKKIATYCYQLSAARSYNFKCVMLFDTCLCLICLQIIQVFYNWRGTCFIASPGSTTMYTAISSHYNYSSIQHR